MHIYIYIHKTHIITPIITSIRKQNIFKNYIKKNKRDSHINKIVKLVTIYTQAYTYLHTNIVFNKYTITASWFLPCPSIPTVGIQSHHPAVI